MAVRDPVLIPSRPTLSRLPKRVLTEMRADYARRLVRESGVPLQRHKISDDALLAAYQALRERTEE